MDLGSESEFEEGFTEGSPQINRGRWTNRERRVFEEGFRKHGKEWKLIAKLIKTRTVIQIRTHAQKYFQKLAKQTGGPVMSTSKKERFPAGFSPKKAPLIESDSRSPIDELDNDDSLSLFRNARPRKRGLNSVVMEDTRPVKRAYTLRGTKSRAKSKRNKDGRGFSLDTLAGSSSEQGSVLFEDESVEEDEISKELAVYNGSLTEEPTDKLVSGRVTPSMLAAATLLVAPKLNDIISSRRLVWARNVLSQY